MKLPARLAVAGLSIATFLSAAFAQQPPSWPHTFSSPVGSVTIYEPQVDSFNQTTLTSHAAVSIVPTGQTAPVFGAMWFSAQVQTDRDNRTVQLENVTVTNSRFPQALQNQTGAITQAVVQDATGLNLSLDNILAALAQTQQQQTASADLNNNPPQIVFSDVPSVLVTLDGQPQLSSAGSSGLMQVVNTPFFICLDPSTKLYYLRGPGQWLSASDIMGSWQTASNVPQAVIDLSNSAKAKDAKTAGDKESMESGTVPKIIVATQPTELIQTDGAAEFSPIQATNLLYVSNTDSDVFMDITTQQLYVLLSGRWYTAATQAGPWSFIASNALPSDFTNIPSNSPKAAVLASVSGTAAANNAVLDASVPQTAAVKRDAKAPEVKYDGDPKFQDVQGTSMQYASNTSHSVIKVENQYYLCSEGIWYVGGAATGPWVVCADVPEVIYTIPPTCPVYNVTYCKVYSSTPDVVYMGYLPGYVGSYVWGGTVVYGTGWPYTPWVGSVYIPRPCTWGFAATYNPWSCGWGFSVGVGWGAASFSAGWSSNWWGAGGWHGNSWNNNNWNSNNNVNINRNVTNNYSNTTNNIYNRTGNNTRVVNNSTHVNAGHNTINSGNNNGNDNRVRNRENNNNQVGDRGDNDGNRVRNREGNGDNNGERRRNEDGNYTTRPDRDQNRQRNDVYAGNDGNVYKHSMDGWQRHNEDNGGWQPTRERNDNQNFQRNVQPNLNRDFSARNSGGGGFDRGGGGGSFHGGGGGGFRGGGGRR